MGEREIGERYEIGQIAVGERCEIGEKVLV